MTSTAPATLLLLAVVAAVLGLGIRVRGERTGADLLLTASGALAGVGAALVARLQDRAQDECVLVGLLAALVAVGAAYAWHRAVVLQAATVVAAAGSLVAAFDVRPAAPDALLGVYLLLLAAFLLLLSLAGVARPRETGVLLAGALAPAGLVALAAAGSLDGDVVFGLVVITVVLIVVRAASGRPAPNPPPLAPGRDWVLPVPYATAFETVVLELTTAGVPLQLVDRVAGRVVAGPPGVPWLSVALWSDEPHRTRIRASGPAWNVDRLRASLDNRLATPH